MTGCTIIEQSGALKDCRGVPVSYGSSEAIAALEHAHESYLAFHGDPLVEVNRIIEQHPGFILAHLFKAAYLTQVLETRVRGDLVNTVSAAEELAANANEREQAHLQAVIAWVKGDLSGAVLQWERALAMYPQDLLALQIIHLTHVLFGEIAGQRDVVARVFSLWDEEAPGFEYVLGFYAFGLEENRDFHRAEKMAMHSLQLCADNPYAVHAICHLMDMQGRPSDGLHFMYHHSHRWAESGFAIHLWWHTALLHLYLQDFDRVLEIYDNNLRSSPGNSGNYEEFDAAALLWRLELVGVDVGNRWAELADKWEPSAQDMVYAFNNVHAMMTFVSDSRDDASRRLLAASEQYVEEASGPIFAAIRDVALPFCVAIKDFHDERYSECVDRLLPVRSKAEMLGGSFVQRDILQWTMLEAAIRAGRYDLALALANERCQLKPGGVQQWQDVARAAEGAGKLDLAKKARAKAQSLFAWQSHASREN